MTLTTSDLPQLWDDADGPRVRPSDPVTSHEAADSNDAVHSVSHVLALLTWYGPMADHELLERSAHEGPIFGLPTYSPSRLRTARNTLARDGRVEFAGIYRLTATNRRAQVWQVSV